MSRVKTPADGEVPPTEERSVYIWHGREVLAEYDQSKGGSLELYKQYFRAAGRLVAVKMYGFHGRREPGPEGFLHTKGGLMYYHTDRLGSPVAITDRHGEPIARYAWDAYGRAMAGAFTPYNTVGFTGKQRDGATGLTYFGARWYDERRNVTRIIEPGGAEKRFTWDPEFNRLVSMFDGRGSWSWQYDGKGNLLLQEDPAGRSTRYEGYNRWGRPQVVINGAGEATHLGYDQWGNLAEIEVPGKGRTEITYDEAGRERRAKRSGYDPVRYNWAPSNDELRVIDSAGAEHLYRFNGLGQLTLYRDPRGGTHQRKYNALGHLTEYIDPAGSHYTWQRNLAGEAVEYLPPAGGKVVMHYDPEGRLAERIAPGDRRTAYWYDDAGRLVKLRDAEEGVTSYEYDVNGRLQRVERPGGITMSYEYDRRGYLATAVGPGGRSFSWQRDGSGLVRKMSDPEGSTYYEYDGAGRVRKVTDIAGRSTFYEYKASDLVKRVKYPGETVEFSYDEAGRMTEAIDPDMSERFSYDRAGRLEEVFFVEAGKRVGYEYTQRGEISRIIDPEGRSLDYERDILGRTSAFHGPEQVSANFSYDALSRPLTAAYGNGTSGSWNWNSAGLMSGYRWQSPGGQLFDRSYGYDKLRRLTERREAQYRWDWDYDAAGRLAEARYPEGLFENIRAWQEGQFPPGHAAEYGDIYSGVPSSTMPVGLPPGQAKKPGSGEAWDEEPVLPALVATERWNYDGAANITERRRDGQREDFQYSALNRLMKAGAITYHYNRAGELTEKSAPEDTAEYEWNGRGELVEAELSDGSTVSYGYDAFGRMVRRVETPTDGEIPPVAERSVYIWNQREILAEYDESRGGSLAPYKQYFRAADRLVAVKMYGFHGRREPGPEGFLHTKGGLMYYHTDRLGSPVAITDRHGEPVARYAWDAYGRAMAGVFDPYNTVGFTGKQLDGATGLTYFGARWYDADSGRFMSRDPIRDGWNWYAYVGGDPVNYVDQWGLSEIYANDITGKPIVAYPGRDITSESKIEVNRGNGSKNYPDTLEIKVGNQKLYEENVLSKANWDDPDDSHDVQLRPGNYSLTMLPEKQSSDYLNAISVSGNGIDIDWGYLIHPNVVTNPKSLKFGNVYDPPISSGCIITDGVESFNTFRNELEGLGYRNDWQSTDMTINGK